MKYIIHSLIQILVILGLANLCLAFVPRTIRQIIIRTFKLAYKITRLSVIQLKKVVKKIYADHKKIEQPKKRKYTRKKNTDTKVIQFPKTNVK